MIALAKFLEAERLLATGMLSQRKIAAQVGLSRATVKNIALGKRRDYEDRARAREAAIEPTGPLARCTTCGGRVYMPCRLCALRAVKQQQQQIARAARRRAREQALRQLLAAVRRANWERDAIDPERPSGCYLPPAEATGPSDCR